MKVLLCREIGFECAHEIYAQTEEDVLRQAAEHARQEHGVEVTPELAIRVQRLIRDQQEKESV